MENRIKSFAPVVDKNSKILILGSIPGVKSLELEQYYAHPQNQFWTILFQLMEVDFTTDYTERVLFLKKHGIALWDVIETCERNGSLDTAIRNEEANDVNQLLIDFPSIKAVFCNGQKSFKNFRKMKIDSSIPIFSMPSTSPAYTKPLNFKVDKWQEILSFL